MPRANRATGRNYTSRAPLPHPDARRRNRRQQDATYVTEPPRDDDGSPPILQVARSTRVPQGTEWVRRVDRVVPNAHNIRMFEGDYHQLSGDRINACPGSVFLVCSKDRRGDEWIRVYVYLPDDLWYDTQTPPVQRTHGWHRIVRNYISGWTALTKVQRVVRACTLAEVALQEAFHAGLRGTEDEGEAEITDEMTEIMGAIEHFREIATRVTGDINELTEDAIRRSFRAWADGVAESTSTSYDAVVSTLSDALVEPTPDTGGTLTEQLQELASWVPDRGPLEHLDKDELTQVILVTDNVRHAVAEERQQREWQFNVLRRLGMNRRKARDAAQDRSLTEVLVAEEYETAVNYLDRFYDVRDINPDTVEEVLNVVANQRAAERQHLPTKENRLARRIRIGRGNA